MEQEWSALHELVDKFGWEITFILAGGFFGLTRLDVVKRLFVGRLREKNDEREQLSEDTQRFIDNLQKDADRQRQWRIDDARDHEQVITGMRARIEALEDTIVSSERGNSRLRHSLRAALAWGAAVRHKAVALGAVIDPFPFDQLMELDMDLATKMREIFEESDQLTLKRLEDKSGEQ